MRYEKPRTAAQAARLLGTGPTRAYVLAGGTDLLVQMKTGRIAPDLIVDIKKIEGIGEITPEAGGYRIGAGVPGTVLSGHAGVRALWPGVAEGSALIGSTQVQGRATMAGNLCNASPAADSVPPLVAADASVHVVGPGGERDCPVLAIPTAPGQTTLERGEIITSIFLPARPARAADAYLRFTPRSEMDIGVVSAAVSLELDEAGTISAARVALGAIAPTVRLVAEAAATLTGTRLDAAALEALAAACSAACAPIDDKRGTVEFRTQVAGVLARRAATLAYHRAGGRS